MGRLRYNLEFGTLGADINVTGTTITFAAAPGFNTISGVDYIPLTLNQTEIVWLTTYTAGAVTGIVSRGKEGTTASSHSSGDSWEHSPSVIDYARSFGGPFNTDKLMLWVRPEELDLSYNDNDPIQSWEPPIAGLRGLIHAATSVAPTIDAASVGGHTAVLCSDALMIPSAGNRIVLDDAYTIFVVIKATATATQSNAVIFGQNEGATTGRFNLRRATAETGDQYATWFFNNGTSHTLTTTTAVFDSTPHLISLRGDGAGGHEIWPDDVAVGSPEDSVTGQTLNPIHDFSLGDNLTDINPWDGHIAEVIMFNRSLSDTEFDDVRDYINYRYSIW